jgi:hypothetical protein
LSPAKTFWIPLTNDLRKPQSHQTANVGEHPNPPLFSHCALHYTLHTALHTAHYTLHNAHYTLHTTHCTLHTTYCTLHYTLHTTHCTLHTAHFTLYTAHCTQRTAHCTTTEKVTRIWNLPPSWRFVPYVCTALCIVCTALCIVCYVWCLVAIHVGTQSHIRILEERAAGGLGMDYGIN